MQNIAERQKKRGTGAKHPQKQVEIRDTETRNDSKDTQKHTAIRCQIREANQLRIDKGML